MTRVPPVPSLVPAFEVVAELGPRVMAAHLDVTDPGSWRVFLDSVADLLADGPIESEEADIL